VREPGPRRAAHPVHESVRTTHIYLAADMMLKEQALNRTTRSAIHPAATGRPTSSWPSSKPSRSRVFAARRPAFTSAADAASPGAGDVSGTYGTLPEPAVRKRPDTPSRPAKHRNPDQSSARETPIQSRGGSATRIKRGEIRVQLWRTSVVATRACMWMLFT